MSASCCSANHDENHHHGDGKIALASALLCGAFVLLGYYFSKHGGGTAMYVCYVLSYICGGWDAFIDSWANIKHGKLDIHFLMLFVAVGAAIINEWNEGAILLFLFSLSGALEEMANARTERAIESLFQDAPKEASLVLDDGTVNRVPVEDLQIGQTIRILPGDMVPLDAKIIKGTTATDESMLSGEAVPVEKNLGDEVFGGTLNTWGAIDASVMHLPTQSAQQKIMQLIRDAQKSKAPSQRFTDRFGTRYTVGIILLSLGAFLVWHYIMKLPAFHEGEKHSAFYRAMSLLVVCSPCALVISIPSAILTGIAAAAKNGILFRGGIALENLAGITRIALDKTGTLTKGEFHIRNIDVSDEDARETLYEAAASLSQQSTHPLSRAIAADWLAKKNNLAESPHDYESIAGQGVRGIVKGQASAQGRRSMFSQNEWLEKLAIPESGTTEVIISLPHATGRIILQDTPRTESKALIQRFQKEHIKIAMLTGDRPESAKLIADELLLDDVRASLTPDSKVAAIKEWQAKGEIVAMVGDGVNDAPSLATADIAIGMGLRGSDATLEQADVVLLNDKIEKLFSAWELSKKCRRIIKQNIVISLGVLVLLGIINLLTEFPLSLGVMGHEGSTLIVVLNSLRLLRSEK